MALSHIYCNKFSFETFDVISVWLLLCYKSSEYSVVSALLIQGWHRSTEIRLFEVWSLHFNIIPPVSIGSLFGTWLAGVEHTTVSRIRIGICALIWAIWNCRNDIIFNRKPMTNFLQVIFRATAWIRTWSLLTPTASREQLATGCNRWKMAARVFFNRFGWQSLHRIGP